MGGSSSKQVPHSNVNMIDKSKSNADEQMQHAYHAGFSDAQEDLDKSKLSTLQAIEEQLRKKEQEYVRLQKQRTCEALDKLETIKASSSAAKILSKEHAPCTSEEALVVKCFKSNNDGSREVSECSQFIDQYVACANKL